MIRAAFVALMVLLSGCASSGVRVDQASASQFTAGQSTCSDVRAKLGAPNVVRTSQANADETVWIYAYASAQAHPENFIPVVGAFVGGYDHEGTMAAFRFTSACVLDGTRYASMNMGSGTNLEGVAQDRKDTRVAE